MDAAASAATRGLRAAVPGLGRLRRLSIRDKLLAMVLLPLAVVLPLLGAIVLAWSTVAFDRLLVTKARSDLAVAQSYFRQLLNDVGASAGTIAGSQALHQAMRRGSQPELVGLLQRAEAAQGLDFVNLRAPDGTALLSDVGLAIAGQAAAGPPPADEGARVRATLEVLGRDELLRTAPRLLPRVAIPLLATRNAMPTDRSVEERALLAIAQAPIRGERGELLGYLQTGVLLNRNLPFIDYINSVVYPEGSLPFGSRGTATLFLDDVRIATNVRLFGDGPDDRAIGTRVSQAVRSEVFERGGTWLGRAFVVNDWYVSGYEPLQDGSGRRVGMLYVGFLERPFLWVKYGTLAGLGLVFLLVTIGAAVVSLRWAREIFAPVERMADTIAKVEAGRHASRVGPLASTDELGRLAAHLDRLLDAIDEKTRALQQANSVLDAKVAARTAALESAQAQIVRNERLAAIGQLTASVAHEINNPMAVIQGNLDLARELIGAPGACAASEFRLIDAQIERVRLIATQLLQLARPGELAGELEALDCSAVFDDCLRLIEHLRRDRPIEVRRDDRSRRPATANRHELQQVLVNLLSNAVHAMPAGGELTLSVVDAGAHGVALRVADTGPGLEPGLIKELFKPFVTRRKDGTGLGLWICRNIVERRGGRIEASNRSDGVRGAVFTVHLAGVDPAGADPGAVDPGAVDLAGAATTVAPDDVGPGRQDQGEAASSGNSRRHSPSS